MHGELSAVRKRRPLLGLTHHAESQPLPAFFFYALSRNGLRPVPLSRPPETTPGDVINYDIIRKRINELRERYYIREFAIDRWNATQLQDDGFEMVAFGQGYANMNFPTKKLEEVVLSGQLRHRGNPVLRWMAGNVSAEKDAADNWKPPKKKSRERIDGIMALNMGLSSATTHQGFHGFWAPDDGVFL